MRNPLLIGIMSQQGIDADVARYLGSLTTALSSEQVAVLNRNIKGLKKDLGISALVDAFDVIHHLGSETAEGGLKNLVKRDNDATAIDNCVHTPYIGYNGDGSTKYIDMNYAPATHGDNFEVDNASYGVYKHEDETGFNYDFGARDGSNLRGTWIAAKISSTTIRAHISDDKSASDSLTVNEGTNPNTIALYTVSRLLSTGFKIYRQDVEIAEADYNSSALTQNSLFVCGMNNTGALFTAVPSTKQLGLAFTGRGFSDAEMVHVSYWFNKLVAETKALI